jgi:transposase
MDTPRATKGYGSPAWAGKFLDELVPPDHTIPHRTHEEDRPFATQSSRIHPKLFPRSKDALQRRRGGPEQQAKVTIRKSYGFRTYCVLELALYHSLGKLPELESTHDFF